MFKTKKLANNRRRSFRDLAFILGRKQPGFKQSNNNNSSGTNSSLKSIQVSSQGFETTELPPQSAPTGRRPFNPSENTSHDDGNNYVRMSEVPKYVTAAESMAVIRGEQQIKPHRGSWKIYPSETIVREDMEIGRELSSQLDSVPSSSQNALESYSMYFNNSFTARRTPLVPGANRRSKKSPEPDWNPLKVHQGAYKSPWVTRTAATINNFEEDFVLEDEQPGEEEAQSYNNSIREMIEVLCQQERDENVDPVF